MKVRDYQIKERTDPDLIICRDDEEYEIAKKLIQEYADSLSISLEFQDFGKEISNLKNHYGPPTGLIIMTREGDEFVGCLCIRNLGDFTAEIKRNYVKPAFRGRGHGRRLLNKAIEEAKGLGYRYLRLDTIPDMKSAIRLYESCGFYEIEGYAYNPILGARFMEYKL